MRAGSFLGEIGNLLVIPLDHLRLIHFLRILALVGVVREENSLGDIISSKSLLAISTLPVL
jgi:hypothetical protein